MFSLQTRPHVERTQKIAIRSISKTVSLRSVLTNTNNATAWFPFTTLRFDLNFAHFFVLVFPAKP
ncbi:hypothetical protein D9758_004974 [Tetrapyrgos nigripes]|uniref:Uncharacterized protein n=1 Tax=Tetrapyrgos nigripes TaxID=182062 RepID=A0A8H5LW43_9AGAR|nr:hypothetical protein D9758_004974 [Tetrapyrgos nigripes]